MRSSTVSGSESMRLVLIEWVDAYGCSSSWQDLDDDCQPKTMLCRSVGWLFRDGSEYKVIIPHIADVPDDLQQGCGDMTIPTCCVRSICDLERRDAPASE